MKFTTSKDPCYSFVPCLSIFRQLIPRAHADLFEFGTDSH